MKPESAQFLLDTLEDSLATTDLLQAANHETNVGDFGLITLFEEPININGIELSFRKDSTFSDLNIQIDRSHSQYQAWRMNGLGASRPEKEWVFEKRSYSTDDTNAKTELIAALALAVELVADHDHVAREPETLIEFDDNLTDGMEAAIKLLSSRDSITGPKLVFEKITPRPTYSETFEVTTLSNDSNTSEEVTEKKSYSKYRVKFEPPA